MKTNRQWIFKSRPNGVPTSDNFQLIESPLPTPKAGELLIKSIYLSVDPYIRGRMRNVRSYVAPLEIGQVIDGGMVGQVLDSQNPNFKKGDYVVGRLGWQDCAVSNGENLRKLDLDPKHLSLALGVLGMTGFTAYFGLLDLGKPQAGETVLVSTAAGAVGSIVGQIAKLKGCRVVGIAGSDEKVKWITEELGFDAGINYKTEKNIRKAIKDACPHRIDVYFDNVGGEISDAALSNINRKGRIIICGQSSILNREVTEMGPRNLLYLLVYRARMEGFLVHDYESRFGEAVPQLMEWLKQGKIKNRETITEGLENTPQAFIGLFSGDNIGKQLVKV